MYRWKTNETNESSLKSTKHTAVSKKLIIILYKISELQQFSDALKRDPAKSVDIGSIRYCECPNYIIWHQFKLKRAGWVGFRHHWSVWWSVGARSGAAAEVGFDGDGYGWWKCVRECFSCRRVVKALRKSRHMTDYLHKICALGV
uniref:Uncharacterized protein n=1 Tax=Elaeophora elaphi TaxID=1147741 RepID=A0A0R3RZT2_9BILA